MSSSSHSYSKTEDQTTQPCCAKASSELKLYQAFIFSVPIFSIFILAFFFYLFYLCCFRRPQSRPASLHTTDDDDFSTSELGLKKEHREMLPIIIFKETFSVKDTHATSSKSCSLVRGPLESYSLLESRSRFLVFFLSDIATSLWLVLVPSAAYTAFALSRDPDLASLSAQIGQLQHILSTSHPSPSVSIVLKSGCGHRNGGGGAVAVAGCKGRSVTVAAPSFCYRCSVCLADYQAEDRLQQIPACGHTFHTDCIDLWLATHTTCPLCRLSLIASAKASTEPLDVPETSSRYHPPVAAGDETQSHQIGHRTSEESWISQQCSGSGNGDERSLEMSNGEERTNSEFVERDRH
ncbi:hypothetical protein TEA_023588 [Camellia sinensis var. sinensis]|uniref:RING-type E3 ubiquitin transferase n=1 Tax=Camellia sinensis var. sinensis TaxID=542762 RepID=A0A4S4EZW0_CAMSN|nr:hypothetical protein TEA_023588 [Camellia sinensis var. sinensis]